MSGANNFCRKCGNRLGTEDVFCSKCGEKIGLESHSKEKRNFINKCEACGGTLKQITPNSYVCEYCGSEYFTNSDNVTTDCKITESEILNVFYKAAGFEVKNQFWDELQCLLSVENRAFDNAVFMVKLGRAYRRNNMYEKAMECYEKAKCINSEYANIYVNIGAVYILTKQYERAEVQCKKAVGLMNENRIGYSNDDYAVAYSNLTIAVGMQGRKEEAKKYLKVAEANGYKNGEAVRKMVGIKKGLFF